MLLYQNCGQQVNQGAPDPLVFKIDDSNLALEPGMDPTTKAELCAGYDYVCEHRVYSPESSEMSQSDVCVDTVVFGRPVTSCAKTLHIQSDSSSAIANCTDCQPEDSKAGGRYNHEEFFCYHPNIEKGSKLVVTHDGAPTLADTLIEAIKLCEELLGP